MAQTGTPSPTTTRCAGCGRKLTATASVARGLGPTCNRRIKAAVAALALHTKPAQISKAAELIRTGAIVRIETDVYSVVSSDGITVYYVDHGVCGCPAGMHGRECKHLIARNALELVA
jgi:hypothetical protein